MAKLKYRTLHLSVRDPKAWAMLADLHQEGWSIIWSDYAEHQWHFLLVGDVERE